MSRSSVLKARMIDRHRLEELAVVIDDQRHGQPRQRRLVARQLAAIELQLDVPAEGGNPRRQRGERIPREHAAREQVKARPSHTGRGQPLEFALGHVKRYGGDSARGRAEGGEGGEGTAVIEAVAVRLHDDGARQAERALHLQVIGQRRVRGLERCLRHQRVAVLVDVHMAVAGARGNAKLG